MAETVAGGRMGAEQEGEICVLLAAPVQGHEHGGQTIGVVAAAGRHDDAHAIRLELVLTVEPLAVDLHADADQRIDHLRVVVHQHSRQILREAGSQLLLQRYEMMAAHDVRYLVADHAGELGLVSEHQKQPSGHEDVPAGRGKGVHRVGVDDSERPWQIRTFGLQRKPAPEPINVTLNLGIVDQRCRAQQAGR